MHDNKPDRGVAPYGGPAPHSRAQAVLHMIRRKIVLRCELALETSAIQKAVSELSEAENAELRALLEAEDARLDQDMAALRVDAQRLAAEAAAARNVRPLSVPLSKTASAVLAREIPRRLELGHCKGRPELEAKLANVADLTDLSVTAALRLIGQPDPDEVLRLPRLTVAVPPPAAPAKAPSNASVLERRRSAIARANAIGGHDLAEQIENHEKSTKDAEKELDRLEAERVTTIH